ncbi:hypothetical protein CsSME_00041506 [Camellia sinensis var. sinensis]
MSLQIKNTSRKGDRGAGIGTAVMKLEPGSHCHSHIPLGFPLSPSGSFCCNVAKFLRALQLKICAILRNIRIGHGEHTAAQTLGTLLRFSDNGNASGNPTQNAKPVSVHPMPSVDGEQPKEGIKKERKKHMDSLRYFVGPIGLLFNGRDPEKSMTELRS